MHAITPTREENYSEWYQQVISEADLAENSPVRGCMIIKPLGFGLWEQIQQHLDRMLKETGHQNVYFPLLIPLSFFEQEAQHVEGFAKECAVVTHRRLETGPNGSLVPSGELEEPLIVRPTSETIIGAALAKWVQSYRDLPLLLNQWCNVVRWEMRTRLFLRSSEFLWQEGHTAHASEAEAREETRRMLTIYARFAREYLALPVISGEKCTWERFPGAANTYSIEAMMQDRKALQAGTSHFLGQHFAKAAGIQYQTAQGDLAHAWTTSWGVSTRLIGALIMAHGDDDGLVIPPRVAPYHVVILPIFRTPEDQARVLAVCQSLADALRSQSFHTGQVQVQIDTREMRGGDKLWSCIKRGIPLRLEIGPRDVAAATVMVGRRDQPPKQKQAMAQADLVASICVILNDIQSELLTRAKNYQDTHTCTITDRASFERFFAEEDDMISGGFALCPFVDSPVVRDALARHKVTVRCIPFDQPKGSATCFWTGQTTDQWAVLARAY